jgi:L-Lysine epsilon oxidase N-terminal
MVRNLTRNDCVVLFPLVAAVGMMLAAQAAPGGGTVGTGPGNCNDAALRARMAGGGAVVFNCGPSATILVTNSLVITQATTLNGGNTVTLTGGLATNLLYQNPGVSLAVSNIILDSAFNTNSRGGAIWSGGPLTLTHVTVQHSQTSNQYCGIAVSLSKPASSSAADGRHRDGQQRIKRQGARFRIYEYPPDESGRLQPLREITAAEAEIQWDAQLANRKPRRHSLMRTSSATPACPRNA